MTNTSSESGERLKIGRTGEIINGTRNLRRTTLLRFHTQTGKRIKTVFLFYEGSVKSRPKRRVVTCASLRNNKEEGRKGGEKAQQRRDDRQGEENHQFNFRTPNIESVEKSLGYRCKGKGLNEREALKSDEQGQRTT